MRSGHLVQTFAAFLFGLLVGALGAVVVVREAVPLREHAYVIGIYLACALPLLLIVFAWYLRTVRVFRRLLGEKAGDLVANFTAFVFVGLFVVFLIVIGLLYAATV